jgi:tRNA threonylcarbamoyladenosine modification (KEOPS) complex Cgi121 subunit
LLKYIKEYERYILLTGFRNAKIENIEEFFKTVHREKPSTVEIQFFDAEFIATWQHLYFAVLNALTAFKNRENISKNLAMEIMTYASAQRQIRKAMEQLGVKPTTSNIAVLIIGEKPETINLALSTIAKHFNALHDDSVLELTKEKALLIRKFFDVSVVELKTLMRGDNLDQALIDLVIERMAILATQR